jgi:hypothetical protein
VQCSAGIGSRLFQLGFDCESQRRERSAQLVRRVRAEGAFAFDEVFEAGRRLVERRGQSVGFRNARPRGAHGEVAMTEPGRGYP